MAKKKQNEEVIVDVERTISNAEAFLQENKNLLMGIAAAIIVGVGGYLGFTKLYLEPRENEAQYELYLAQEFIAVENFEQALNGDEESMGLLAIADEFSMTKAANLANYYAGVAYLNMGEYKNAIVYLDKFSTKDDILRVVSKGAIGDAFMELGQTKEALEFYEKAVRQNDNNLAVPIFLKKAGQTSMMLDNPKKALGFFKELKEKFPESPHAVDADKYIAMLETQIANKS